MFNNSSIGILGAGFIAEEYLKVLASKNIFCEAIYSRTFSKALRLKKVYKIKKICKTLKEFFKQNKNASKADAMTKSLSH